MVSSFSLLLLGFSRFRCKLVKISIPNDNSRKQAGFTLAEVLITLGIIGVVAAMTMPTLVAKYEEKATVTKLKKFYSIFSQSYIYAVQENGLPSQWGLTGRNIESATIVRDIMLTHVKKIKMCDGSSEECGKKSEYKTLGGSLNSYNKSYSLSASLADGSTAIFISNGASTGYSVTPKIHNWAEVQLDVNGIKPPNTLGKDLFLFYISDNGIVPAGIKDDNYLPFKTHCSLKGISNGCAAWVIYNENMDYLHCDDLSWEGKTKCK